MRNFKFDSIPEHIEHNVNIVTLICILSSVSEGHRKASSITVVPARIVQLRAVPGNVGKSKFIRVACKITATEEVNIHFSFSNNLYLGLEGDIEVDTATDTTLIGAFNTVMLKPAFYFPPHTISITNGEFQFFDVELPVLNNTIENGSSPNYFEINSVYPNPFNSATNIEVLINSNNVNTSLYIVDITGKKVQTIFNKKMETGRHLFNWNSNQNPSGIYFSVLKTNTSIKTKKLMLIK